MSKKNNPTVPKTNLFSLGFIKSSPEIAGTASSPVTTTEATDAAGRKRAASASAINYTQKKTMIMEAAKAASLSGQTRTSFIRDNSDHVTFPLVCGNLAPSVKLSHNAALLFLSEWVPSLATCDAVLRYGRGVKPKYFSIFSLLSLAALLSGGRCEAADDDLHDAKESEFESSDAQELKESGQSEEEVGDMSMQAVPLSTADLQLLRRYIGHEERISGGSIEFTTHKDSYTNIIDSLWEIKYKLSKLVDLFQAEKSEIWQFYKELVSANAKNKNHIKSGEALPPVWGALSDDETWIFARISNPPGEKILIELSRPLTFHKGRRDGQVVCTGDTAEVIDFIFTAIHGPVLGTNESTIEVEDMESMMINVRNIRSEAVCKTNSSFETATAGARHTGVLLNLVSHYKLTAGNDATMEKCAAHFGAKPNTPEFSELQKIFESL